MQYIIDLAKSVLASLDPPGDRNIRIYLTSLTEEVDRLDPRDFQPNVRASFVTNRGILRVFNSLSSLTNKEKLRAPVQALITTLEHYGLATRPTRTFRWISAPDLATIVQRDYEELSQKVIPDGAWKSAVVLAGSITEAILFDLLTAPARLAASKAAPSAFKPSGAAKSEDDWNLHDMIKIAAETNLITTSRANTFDQVLRDYRNFVHPRKEVRSGHPCGEGEAFMAKGALDALCDHFDRTLP